MILRIFSISIVTFLSINAVAQDREIQFQHENWEKILNEAKTQNKLVFLDAYASWCGPCKWMAANAFKNNEAADYYNENFICAKIDMEKGEGIELARTYGVRSYPTLIFLDHTGEVVHRSVGALDASNLIQLGKEALNPDMQLSTWDDKFADGNRSPEFIKGYLDMRVGAGYRDNEDIARDYFAEVEQAKYDERINWNIFYQHVWDPESEIFQHYFAKRNDMGERKDSLYWKIGESLWRSAVPVVYDKEVTDHLVEKLVSKIEGYDFEETGKVIYKIRSTYASRHKEWKDFEKATLNDVRKYEWDNFSRLNQLAWSYYENAESKKALKTALKWAERSVELNEQPFNLDTQASLLFKLGQVDEAIKVEEKALKLAEKSGQDISSYKEALQKFKGEN